MNEAIAELYIDSKRLEEWLCEAHRLHHEAYLTVQEPVGPCLPGGLVELHRWGAELNRHRPLEEGRSTEVRGAFHCLYQSTIGCTLV